MRAYAFLGDALLVYQDAVVAQLNVQHGFAIAAPTTQDLADLEEIARGETALLFVCGLPYVRLRDRGLPLEPLAAPVSLAHPAESPGYCSLLLGRPGLVGQQLDALDALRLGINSYDSMSGWVLPAGSGMPLGRFRSTTVTHGHRRSMELLLAGAIDAAPIDSMLLAAESVATPAFGELPVLAAYGPTPSPPVVLVGGDPDLADQLRGALTTLAAQPSGAAALALGAIARFAATDDATYDPTRACDRRAAQCTH